MFLFATLLGVKGLYWLLSILPLAYFYQPKSLMISPKWGN